MFLVPLLLGMLADSPGMASEARLFAPDDPALARALEDAGWTVERRPGGDLLIRPGDRDAPAATPAAPAAGDAVATEAMADRLRELGWEMSRDAQGNLFLRPVSPQGDPE
jgi:hypothetical protein